MVGSGSFAGNHLATKGRRYDEVKLTIDERWILQEKLGKGGYGTVYSAFDKKTRNTVAVKMDIGYVESFGATPQREVLKDEFEIMEKITQRIPENISIGFPRAIYFASSEFMRVLVMERLGKTVCQTFWHRHPKLEDVYDVAIQVLSRLEHMHNMGFVHLDLKTDNMFFGRDHDPDRVYLADFGLSERYLLSNGRHRPNGLRAYTVGPEFFASLNVLEYQVPSRRDDIESLGYNIMFMYFKSLPWTDPKLWHLRHYKRNPDRIQNLNALNYEWVIERPAESTKEQMQRGVEEMKRDYPLERLCKGLPGMKEFMEHARSLRYAEKPDYRFLRRTLARKIGTLNRRDMS